MQSYQYTSNHQSLRRIEGLDLEGSQAKANTKEGKDKEYNMGTYDRFIQKTIANLVSSHLLQPPSNAKKTRLKQPYTSYNIYFRLEHAYIVQSTEGVVDEEVLASLDPNHSDPVELPRPAKYAHLVLPPYWYSSLHSATVEKKRRHRKRNGRLDMVTLSKTISESWRVADKDKVDYCSRLARVALKFYGYQGYNLQRSGRFASQPLAEMVDADTGAALAEGSELGDGESAKVNNGHCDIDRSQWTNENQKVKEGYQMLLSSTQPEEQSTFPYPDARAIEAMNGSQRTQNAIDNEDVRFSALALHPGGISRSSNEGRGNGLSSQYGDGVFPNSLEPLQNQYADDPFLQRYGYPLVAPDLSLPRAQLLLNEARQAACDSRISMLSAMRPTVSYQSDRFTPQHMLRAMDASNTTASILELGGLCVSPPNDDSAMDSSNTASASGNSGDNSLANNDSAMDSRKPVLDLGIHDNKSPPDPNNARDLPKSVPESDIRDNCPPNEDTQTPDVVPSAIPSSDVRDEKKTPQSNNPICLFIPSDANVLDPIQNFPRCHCIKLFEKREDDHSPGRVGQVGLRCFYCEETCLPSKRDTIYENVLSFQRNHLESCRSFPEQMKAKYKKLVRQEEEEEEEEDERSDSEKEKRRPSQAFLRAYYAEAASELGLVDSPDGGLVFGAPQNTSGVPSKRLMSLLGAAGYNGLYNAQRGKKDNSA